MTNIKVLTNNFEYMGLPPGYRTEANIMPNGEAKFQANGRLWSLEPSDFCLVLNKNPVDEFVNNCPKKATEFLSKALNLLEERGKDYDQPEGERSMGRTVTAFNAITGHSLKESDGWLILQILKDVRQNQNRDSYHADSAEDCISYAALKAEALAENK